MAMMACCFSPGAGRRAPVLLGQPGQPGDELEQKGCPGVGQAARRQGGKAETIIWPERSRLHKLRLLCALSSCSLARHSSVPCLRLWPLFFLLLLRRHRRRRHRGHRTGLACRPRRRPL